MAAFCRECSRGLLSSNQATRVNQSFLQSDTADHPSSIGHLTECSHLRRPQPPPHDDDDDDNDDDDDDDNDDDDDDDDDDDEDGGEDAAAADDDDD